MQARSSSLLAGMLRVCTRTYLQPQTAPGRAGAAQRRMARVARAVVERLAQGRIDIAQRHVMPLGHLLAGQLIHAQRFEHLLVAPRQQRDGLRQPAHIGMQFGQAFRPRRRIGQDIDEDSGASASASARFFSSL